MDIGTKDVEIRPISDSIITVAKALEHRVLEWYDQNPACEDMYKSIKTTQTPVSIRTIESCVVNSKIERILIKIHDADGVRVVCLRDKYKLWLSAFGKIMFDPFERVNTMDPAIQRELKTLTAAELRQRHFFMWLLDNPDILEQIKIHKQIAGHGSRKPQQQKHRRIPACDATTSTQ